MSLPERLHNILLKLRESFDADLPSPDELDHTGEVTIRGEMFTAKSSVALDNFAQEQKFTIYLHTRAADAATIGHEHLYYFHFEGRREISAVYVKLDMVEGNLRQYVTLSSLPREIFVQMVERKMGRGAPRERRPGGGRGRGAMMGGRGRGGRGQPWAPKAPMPMLEDSDGM